jgi:hypothetical protein
LLQTSAIHGSQFDYGLLDLPRGLDYDWSVPNFDRDNSLYDKCGIFLCMKLIEKESTEACLQVPMIRSMDGELRYEFEDSTPTQQKVLLKVFSTLKKIMELDSHDR